MLQVDWDSYVAFPNTEDSTAKITFPDLGIEWPPGNVPLPGQPWICPLCNNVYGPTTQECTRCNLPHEFRWTY